MRGKSSNYRLGLNTFFYVDDARASKHRLNGENARQEKKKQNLSRT